MEFELKVTGLFAKHAKPFKDDSIRLIVSRGGSSSSKTISILQLILIYALNNSGKTVSILGETAPKIKKGVLKDFKEIVMKELWTIGIFNKSDMLYSLPNGSFIQFLSAENEENVRGIRSDVLYADEVNTIKWGVFTQMMIRTRYKVLASFNPTAEFEITDMVAERDDVMEIVSTYKDNEFLEQSIINELEEQAKRDENFNRVFVKGEYGVLTGIIFEEGKTWWQCDELPEVYDKEVWGIDYGFANDPTSYLQVRTVGNSMYIKEHLYETGLITREIARIIQRVNPNNVITISDNARPEINAELSKVYRINIKKVIKPQILASIELLKQRDVYITKDSLNTIAEFRYYSYSSTKKDKFGQFVPVDRHNHSIDVTRYVSTVLFKPKAEKPIDIFKW